MTEYGEQNTYYGLQHKDGGAYDIAMPFQFIPASSIISTTNPSPGTTPLSNSVNHKNIIGGVFGGASGAGVIGGAVILANKFLPRISAGLKGYEDLNISYKVRTNKVKIVDGCNKKL